MISAPPQPNTHLVGKHVTRGKMSPKTDQKHDPPNERARYGHLILEEPDEPIGQYRKLYAMGSSEGGHF